MRHLDPDNLCTYRNSYDSWLVDKLQQGHMASFPIELASDTIDRKPSAKCMGVYLNRGTPEGGERWRKEPWRAALKKEYDSVMEEGFRGQHSNELLLQQITVSS